MELLTRFKEFQGSGKRTSYSHTKQPNLSTKFVFNFQAFRKIYIDGAADLVTGYFTTGNSITPYSVTPYSITRKFNHRENSSPCPFRHPANFVTLPISSPCQFRHPANFASMPISPLVGALEPPLIHPLPPNFSQKPKVVVVFF